MIIAIHNENVTLRGVTYEVSEGVFVELDSGTFEDAVSLYTDYNTPKPKDKLEALEKQYTLTQRNLREFILLTVEALKEGTPVDLSVLPGVQVVAAVEAEAASLRAQL